MSNKKFTAIIENYGFKSNSALLNNENSSLTKYPDDANLLDKDKYFNEKVINLDDLSLADLTGQLSDSLSKNQPMFLWSKQREINKIELDVNRQRLLKTRIETLKEMGEELMHLRADAIVSEKMIVLLSKMNKSKAKAELKRIIEKSETESSYYKRKQEENVLASEKMELENELKKEHGETEIEIKRSKIKLYNLIMMKLKDNSIKDIPVEILHEIFYFFSDNSDESIETIAKYNKMLSEIDMNKAETFKTFAEGQHKMSETEGYDLENQRKLYNMNQTQKKYSQK